MPSGSCRNEVPPANPVQVTGRAAPVKIFRLALWPHRALSQRVTGAFLNALGILIGAMFGLAMPKPLSLRTQVFFRSALGTLTICFGLRLVWLSINGSFLSSLKQILTALFAVMLGNLTGKLLRLQKVSNRLGHHAGSLIASAQAGAPHRSVDGFSACTVLFCAAPLGLLGAVTDGLPPSGNQFGYFWLLAIKAVMDGLAMMGFVRTFGWPPALSAFPVFVFLGAITVACQFCAKTFLELHGLTDSLNAAGGLMACAVALVILEVRRVELANFLPSLVIAPLLAWLIG